MFQVESSSITKPSPTMVSSWLMRAGTLTRLQRAFSSVQQTAFVLTPVIELGLAPRSSPMLGTTATLPVEPHLQTISPSTISMDSTSTMAIGMCQMLLIISLSNERVYRNSFYDLRPEVMEVSSSLHYSCRVQGLQNTPSPTSTRGAPPVTGNIKLVPPPL